MKVQILRFDGDADEAGSEDETGSGETDEKGEEAAA